MQVIFHSMWLALPVIISFNHSAVSLSHASTHYFSHFYLTHLHPLVHNLYFPADPIFFLSNSLSHTHTSTLNYSCYLFLYLCPRQADLSISETNTILRTIVGGTSTLLSSRYSLPHKIHATQVLGTLNVSHLYHLPIIFITYKQCDQIWWKSPLCQKYLAIFWRFMSYFANLWQNWANFHCYKWPNIEK